LKENRSFLYVRRCNYLVAGVDRKSEGSTICNSFRGFETDRRALTVVRLWVLIDVLSPGAVFWVLGILGGVDELRAKVWRAMAMSHTDGSFFGSNPVRALLWCRSKLRWRSRIYATCCSREAWSRTLFLSEMINGPNS